MQSKPNQMIYTAVGQAFVVFLVATVVVFAGLRFYAGYKVQARCGVIEQRLDILEKRVQVIEDNTSARLSELEVSLFGDIAPKVEHADALAAERLQPRHTRIEAWSENRDKELRARIKSLEDSRLELRAQIRRLEER